MQFHLTWLKKHASGNNPLLRDVIGIVYPTMNSMRDVIGIAYPTMYSMRDVIGIARVSMHWVAQQSEYILERTH